VAPVARTVNNVNPWGREPRKYQKFRITNG
jgi:hypothetical protein